MQNDLLIIPEKNDTERESLAAAWIKKGGQVLRLGKFWLKPEVGGKNVSIYGNDTFALVLAQLLDIELISPRDEQIADFSTAFVKRKISIKTIGTALELSFPIFVKPVIPKQFSSKIYSTLESLKSETLGLEEYEKIICSEIVIIDKEVRAFILGNSVADLAYYEGEGELSSPRDFLLKFMKTYETQLPQTYVIDLGWNAIIGWFIIEMNASWGAGLNNCQPERVIECIKFASI